MKAVKIFMWILACKPAIVLCARPIGGSSAVDIEGGFTWRELV